ncbi:hypothetical protein BZG36_01563 [Bifiguratus adelaidae]|uniref:Protein YOP1 n=1 Tax=Bifiguratus adelaidae TaxID=1938954 RepID=A0A261Y418_9FUNG|nr:hypothetical protein BZG36_01563 [Bifiguratus adelaidae]
MLPNLAFFLIKTLTLQLFPAYSSYKAVKTNTSDVLAPSLMYWITISTYYVGEYVADLFVSWLPFYNEIKVAFIFWLVLPQTQGYLILYKHFIQPILIQHEADIDNVLQHAHEEAKRRGAALGQAGYSTVKYAILGTRETPEKAPEPSAPKFQPFTFPINYAYFADLRPTETLAHWVEASGVANYLPESAKSVQGLSGWLGAGAAYLVSRKKGASEDIKATATSFSTSPYPGYLRQRTQSAPSKETLSDSEGIVLIKRSKSSGAVEADKEEEEEEETNIEVMSSLMEESSGGSTGYFGGWFRETQS